MTWLSTWKGPIFRGKSVGVAKYAIAIAKESEVAVLENRGRKLGPETSQSHLNVRMRQRQALKPSDQSTGIELTAILHDSQDRGFAAGIGELDRAVLEHGCEVVCSAPQAAHFVDSNLEGERMPGQHALHCTPLNSTALAASHRILGFGFSPRLAPA